MAIIQADSYPVAGILTEQIWSIHDVAKPQHIPELMSRFGSQFLPAFQMFRAMGKESPIAGDEWYGHEENWYHQTWKNKTLVGDPGINNAGTYTIVAAEHDSKDNTYPREGDIVTFPKGNNYVQGIITEKTSTTGAHTLEIKPLKLGDTIGAIAADVVISITNGAFGAGTGQPQGTVVGTSKRKFVSQIFKETIGCEGSQLVNEPWYKVLDNNKSLKGWYSPGYERGDYLLALKMDGAFLMGEENTNTVLVTGTNGLGNTIKTTRGISSWISELGENMTFTSGTWANTYFDTISLYLRSQGISTGVVLMMIGAKLMQTIENQTITDLTNTGVDYTRIQKTLFGGNDERSVSYNFKTITKGGLTFVLVVQDSWSNPKTFAAVSDGIYDFDEWAIVAPLGKVKDTKTGHYLDSIGTRYREKDGYSRKFEVWKNGAAGGGSYVGDVDKTNTWLRAHLGFQFLKMNQFIKIRPV